MPSIKSSTPGIPGEIPQIEIPLPLAPRHGGLGGPVPGNLGGLLVGKGEQFIEIPHPEKPGHILQSFDENWVGWSNHTLELLADVRLDQSLHRAASPTFSGLRLGGKESGVSLKPRSGEKELLVGFSSDCEIDQDLSKESDVFFKSIRTSSLKSPILRLPELHPVDVGEHALANIKGVGLAMFDGENWIPVTGNLSGKGATGRLAVFSNDKTLVAATGIAYNDNGLGLGVADPAGRLHVRGNAIFEDGVTLGTVGPKTKDGTIGFLEGKVGVWVNNSFKFFGSGEGNVKGKGKAGQLALWKDEDDLGASPAFVSANGSLCSENIIGDYIAASKKLILGDSTLDSKDGKVFLDGKPLGFETKLGALGSEDIEITGQGCVVGASLKLKMKRAGRETQGVASFGEGFSVREGHVTLDFSRMPLVGLEQAGLLSKEDFKRFAMKADSFDVGELSTGDGLSIEGSIAIIGKGGKISAQMGNHDKAGLVRLSEKDFLFREGVAFLRNESVNKNELAEALSQKANAFSTHIVELGQGFASDYKVAVLGGPSRIDLALASTEKFGIARFSERDFIVRDGTVSTRSIPFASSEQAGLMSPYHVNTLEAINKMVSFHVAYQGKVSENALPMWVEGKLQASKLRSTAGGTEAQGYFAANTLLSDGGVLVGSTEESAEKVGAGFLRFERGALEVSNGEQWIRLKAGGLAGHGRAGSLAVWSSDEALGSSQHLSWDEKRGRLGWGVDSPEASLHIASPGASMRLMDTRPSAASAGAFLGLGTDDGADAGTGDTLGTLAFLGRRGSGASIRAVASANWDSQSSPASLAFGTTPDGQTTTQYSMFLSHEGFLGVQTAKPSAPLHLAAKNRNGISAIFDGALRIGSSDQSSSVVGAGCLRYSNGRVEFSDGTRWQALQVAAE